MQKVYVSTLALSLIIILSSCAGPSNPFGSTVGFELKKDEQQTHTIPIGFGEITPERKDNAVKVSFSPSRLVFHDGVKFKVHIDDELGITPGWKIRVIFNHEDTTKIFLKRAKTEISNSGKRLTLSIPGIRFPAKNKNELYIYYQRNSFSPYVGVNYQAPFCDMNKDQWIVKGINDFSVDNSTIGLVNKISGENGLNPAFMAGLIAQESAFNDKAVSHARALGLTQVTSSAGSHVLEHFPDWPSYSEVDTISIANLRFYVNAGFINGSNEWRLNKKKSIEGGIAYLKYLKKYWSMDEQKFILDTLENYDSTDIILASYNSGAYRVKKAMKQMGQHWYRSYDLGEARKYVKRVKSYCYHFYHSDENDKNQETL